MKLKPLLLLACLSASFGASAQPMQVADKIRQPWNMHHINSRFIYANSLGPGDINKDGYPDFAVVDEGLGLYTVVMHPGKNGDVRKEWPTVVIGKSDNAEYSYMADLDGDGNLDIVGMEGDDLMRGYKSGLRIYWGPSANQVMDSTAWVSAGYIPGTEQKQFLFAECHDVNGDGAMDIVVGGRRHPVNRQYAGLLWVEAPANPKDRRNLSKWTIHAIDATALDGHGFVWADIDQDGDPDIVDANADFDTPESDEEIYWYENPGPKSPAVRQPWKKQTIFTTRDFYSKPQVAVADFDGDGLTDVATQLQQWVYLFRKKSNTPVAWERIDIPKAEWTSWVGRPLKAADLDGNGKMDLVGMLTHNDGNIPRGYATVFWMEFTGEKPTADNWQTHTIRWSDGYNSRHRAIGEKWDHCRFYDVDGDGDQDIVANCEEYYHFPQGRGKPARSFLSVVWFENPLK